MSRGSVRAWTAAWVLVLAVAGCGGAAATPTPTPHLFGTGIPNPSNATRQHWMGTIVSTSDRHYFDGGANYLCSDAWAGTLSFTVDGQNAVTGSGVINLQGAAACMPPGAPGGTHGLPPEVRTYNFSVGGAETTTGFDVQFKVVGIVPPPPGSIDVAGIDSLFSTSSCPSKPGPTFSIHPDHPNHVSGVFVLNAKLVKGCPKAANELQIDIFSSTSTIVLNGT